MFLEILFLSIILLMTNFSVTMNSFILTLVFLKNLMLLPKLSILSFSIENSVIWIDKLGFLLFLLTIFSVLMIFMTNTSFPPLFLFLNKTLLFSLILVFITSNLLMFYFFFEITIIPTIMMIIIWGYQPERLQASFYFFFYTILASLPLLIFILFFFSKNKTNFMGFCSSNDFFSFWWIVMIIAFLVKFPMFFFHLWLPKAHVEAPLGGSMILAAVLLKLGGVGIFRMMMLMKSFILSPMISSLSVWGSVLTALICLQQSDMKAMIAYSSVAHMSFLVSSMFLGSEVGLNGAMLMMFIHGLSSASLFMLAKMTYDFSSSRSMILAKGKMNLFPIFSLFWALIITLNMGIPPAGSFWAELLLLFGYLYKSYIYSIMFFLMAFFSTLYSCFLMTSLHHGKILSKMNPVQNFWKQNFCPMFIFSFSSFALFISPSLFFIY